MLRLAIALGLLSGCLEDDCRVGAWRCIGDELQSCEGHGGGVYGPIDDPSYTHSSGSSWENNTACGVNLCIASSDKAFCALERARDPVCGPSGFGCDGNTLVECHEGYAMTRTACLACDAATGGCVGARFDRCTTPVDCAPGMTCSNRACEMPCDTDGVCEATFAESRDPSNGVWVASTCSEGFCN